MTDDFDAMPILLKERNRLRDAMRALVGRRDGRMSPAGLQKRLNAVQSQLYEIETTITVCERLRAAQQQ